jgi:signal transduction histidine kinase
VSVRAEQDGGAQGARGGGADERDPVEVLAAGIAHEVRNPLNALQINVSILGQELAELLPDRQAHAFEVLAKISHELRCLDDFVTEFLRYARPTPPRRERVEVAQLVDDLAAFIGPECSRKGVSLSRLPGGQPLTALIDPLQVKHALLNLVLNALQSTPAGGRIEIEVGPSPQGLAIVIRDTGEGIPEELVGRAFELFWTTREGGTGLGLPIARRLVEAQGGKLELASVPGQGTTATITLPSVSPRG